MLHTTTMEQALGVWSELEQAFYEDNHYGGDEAEIYLYRFMGGAPRTPQMIESPGIMGDLAREDYDNANHAMHDLFAMFAKIRSVKIEVEGRELGEWLKTARFCHRVHVKVVHHER